MAARQARNTGLIVTLVVFVFAFIVSLVLAIMFYTRIEQAKQQTATANTELNKYIESARRSDPKIGEYVAAGQKAENRSVVSYLESEVARLKRAAAGADTMETTRVESELKAAGAADGQSALDVIRALKTDRDNAQGAVAGLQEQVKKLEDQIAELNKIKDRIDADAKAQGETIAAAISKLQADVKGLDDKQKAALAAVEESGKDTQTKFETARQELDNKLRDATKALETAQLKIKDYQGVRENTTPDVPNPSVNVDGEIIGIPQEQSVVYVNLGRKDHLVLGMTFEVFDRNRGVEVVTDANDDQVLRRGKATIEVVSIGETSAVGRIVRSTFGQPTQLGDVIANLVYDRRRKFKFYIFGEFNLDGQGQPSVTDQDMIVNLIERWGGEVVKPEDRERALSAVDPELAKTNILPYDTDFLVLGEEPQVEASTDASDAEAEKRRKRQKDALDKFNRVKEEAKALGIPPINQNRFLALIGYYQR